MKSYKPHPIANLFPLLTGAALKELAADIKDCGLEIPIVLYEDQILDGRNRFAACKIAGVDPRFVEYEGSDPIAHVVSLNLHRRHLNESQRGMVAGKAKVLFEKQAKERMLAGKADPSPNLGEGGKTSAKVAKLLNVGRGTVENASKVQRDGSAALVKAVERGDVAVSTAAVIAELPREEQRRLIDTADEKVILEAAKKIRAKKTEVRRTERIDKIVEISKGNRELDVPERHPLVLADPPWRYDAGSTDPSREIENQYPTMALEDICALPVKKIITDDAILFLWATSPKLHEAMAVITAWGFEYRSSIVWVKNKIGMGYWARSRHEFLLIATRGKFPAPPPKVRPDSVLEAPVGKHSEKPVEAYERIEKMYPSLPKIEMFSRAPREGWSAWGNQSENTEKPAKKKKAKR